MNMTDEEYNDALEEFNGPFEAYVGNVGRVYASVEDFEESYQGVWSDEGEFAYDLGEDIGLLDGATDILKTYFDWDRWTRDLFLGGDYYSITAPDYMVYIFSSY